MGRGGSPVKLTCCGVGMCKERMKLNIYGGRIFVELVNDHWIAYYQKVEGKRRNAKVNVIAPGLDWQS